jgi:uncharacterized membrane protein YbhN (UPF0104 family)
MNEAVPRVSKGRPAVSRARKARTVVGVLIGLGCVTFLGRHLWVWREEVGHAFELRPSTLALLAFFVFAAHAQRALEFNYMLRRLSAKEGLGDSFLLTAVALLLNNFPFSAGSAARAVALQKKHNLHYASYLSALIISALVNAQTAATLGFVMCLAVLPTGGPRDSLVTLFGVAALGGTLAMLAPTSYVPGGETFFARHVRRLIEGLRLIRGRGGLLVLIATSAAKLLFNTMRLWLCFRAMGLTLPAEYVALLGSAAVMISVVNLVPGNIGLRELLVGALSGAMGFSPALGMAAATIDRAVVLSYTFVVGVPSLLAIRRAFSTP